ncbi:MAG: class I SAM-dependent methyltransferase [Planctomycetes bacterium]|nr:class I SAM-dependent methyltransferase [Planctomycetota bacterium]
MENSSSLPLPGAGAAPLRHGALAPEEHWDEVWRGVRLPKTLPLWRYVYWRFDEWLRPRLGDGRGRRLLEVGCAPGAWMVYFRRRFGFEVAGSEYAHVGIEVTRRNLELCRVPAELYPGDFFAYPFPHAFEAVFSFGFVEHFEDTRRPLDRMRNLLVPGGVLVTVIPNLKDSLYRRLTAWTNAPCLDIHVPLGVEELRSLYEGMGLVDVEVGYFGTWNLALVNYGPSRWIGRAALAADEVVKTCLRVFRERSEAAWRSPYVVAIGRKP